MNQENEVFPRPGEKGATYEQNHKYLVEVLGYPEEAAKRIAKRWSRTDPQTNKEVREGIIEERRRRLDSYGRTE